MPANLEILSLRDPAGVLHDSGERLLRVVHPEFSAQCHYSLARKSLKNLFQSGEVVATRFLNEGERSHLSLPASETVLEHERLPFVSYPHEWTPGMLQKAGELTLGIAEKVLADGLGLKDASSYNLVYRGPLPVFVDILSFERRDSKDATWRPYGQFVRHFINPLLAKKYCRVPLQWVFLGSADGLESERLYQMLNPLQRLSPSLFPSVTFPVWLAKRFSSSPPFKRQVSSELEAKFILKLFFQNLRRTLSQALPPKRSSRWVEYAGKLPSYNSMEHQNKNNFVQETLNRLRPARVLDIGCNQGEYSQMAAQAGAEVVALDSDMACVEALWEKKIPRILPVVMDFGNPSPSLGWQNNEHFNFLKRAQSSFDLVFFLAVIHHLQIRRIPLNQILQTVFQVSKRHAIIEYVGESDEMWKVLNRDLDFRVPSRDEFEQTLRSFFETEEIREVKPSKRWLYVLKKKGKSYA